MLMVGLSGLEPPTSRLSGVRSNRLSYRPMQEIFLGSSLIFFSVLIPLLQYFIVNVHAVCMSTQR